MATFNLTGNTTVAELKKAFNDAFGSQIKVYQGGSEAGDTTNLSELGLKADGVLECRSSLTAGKFIERMAERGLKVAIWTRDYHVKVLEGLTLESTGKVKNMARKRDMEDMIAYQRKEDAAEAPAGSGATSGKKEMKTYTVELTDKVMMKIHWSKLDAEGLKELKSMMGTYDDLFEFEDIIDRLDDNWDLVMNEDQFRDGDRFNLKVTDEAGNVVYETKDPDSIIHPDDNDDDKWPQPKTPKREYGTYLAVVEDLKWFTLTGEFKTDNFNPSKFYLCSNQEIAAIFGEDMVDINQFYYGNQCLQMEEPEDYDDYGRNLYKVKYDKFGSDLEEIEAE